MICGVNEVKSEPWQCQMEPTSIEARKVWVREIPHKQRPDRFRNGGLPGYAQGSEVEPVGGFEIVDTNDGNRGTRPH